MLRFIEWEKEEQIEEVTQAYYAWVENREITEKNFISLADSGSVASMVYLGEFYRHGVNCQKDLKKAMFWYKQAENGGWISSAHRQGLIFRMEKSYEDAFTAFEKGAKLSLS